MTPITEKTTFHTPPLVRYEAAGLPLFLDPESPNWAAVEPRAADLLGRADGITPVGRIVADYATARGFQAGKAWLHVHDFFREARRAGLVSEEPFRRPPYAGRLAHGEPQGLSEFWIHTNNSCNLACRHCLVSSGPGGLPGQPTEVLRRAIGEAHDLGARRFYFTGGEPFLRRDLPDLIRWITDGLRSELIVLTNATLMTGRLREALAGFSRAGVKFQVSLDGTRPETNDPIRGAGSFRKSLDGLRLLADLGFEVALTTVVTKQNLTELPELTVLAKTHGARSQHLMWSHRRGRALASDNGFFPETERIVRHLLQTAEATGREGIALDNLEAVRRRVDGRPGLKYDLGNAGWDSICLYADGTVYPSAALAGESALAAGRFPNEPLKRILRASPVLRAFREATIARRESVAGDPLRFLTGGGDIEHACLFATSGNGHSPGLAERLAAPDPYYEIQKVLVQRVWDQLVSEAAARINRRSGYDPPRVVRAMGETSIACGAADGTLAEREVLTIHSNCVLSFDVDAPRALVRQFYGRAAEVPQPDLCCPTTFNPADIDHIPKNVIDRFYGCGSPVTAAAVKPGEVFVDLGCGAGIDVFIAAKKVGREGKAIGVDMTGRMLDIARASAPVVAGRLGYDAAEFREGFLESPPVASRSADVVTSNCVVNLSPDKGKVFAEIWRMLKDGGRAVIADIVSDREVPPSLKTNPELWGECTVGALTEEGFLAALEKAGFFGIEILKKAYWKSIDGYPFYSVTVRGWKFEKTAGCKFIGQRAVYLGPQKAVIDEEGHTFPRGVPIEVCSDTAFKLRTPPYAGRFAVLEPGESADLQTASCCGPEESCC
ncbi:MAG: methyltransferase domain-containing protein [Acidobacteria bacterium]|nr:methyltransferase domain-containing protein [Acidobacteriota bacterium]